MVGTATPTEVTVEPENTALIVVDMQNDFCHEDGALYSEASEAAIDPTTTLIENAQDAGAAVVYTRDVHAEDQFEETENYDEFARWGEHVVRGTWGAELVDALDVQAADNIVSKHTYDAFAGTDLDGFLTNKGIDNVLICGTLANVCVLHTASSAALRDYRTIIVEDALGYIEEGDRDYAVDHADWLFGETTSLDSINFD